MKKVIKAILAISFIFYLIVLLSILFFRGSFIYSEMSLLEYIKYSTNIIPFKSIIRYTKALFDRSMNMSIPITNLVGNLILFLPMGIYLPFFIKKINKMGIYSIYIIILIFLVEIIQLLTRRGIFDIDDLILNLSGALIGYVIWKNKIIQAILK